MSAYQELLAALSGQGLEVAGLVAAHRVEVLAEAADRIAAARGQDEAEDPDSMAHLNRRIGLREAEALVRRMVPTAEARGGEVTREAADEITRPAFFEPGRTYSRGATPWSVPELISLFRVEYVTRHPETGRRRAIGWTRTGEPGARWHGDFADEGEFSVWSASDESGERS